MRQALPIFLTIPLFFGAAKLCAHPGHDARSPMAWLGLGKHSDDYPDKHQGYLEVAQPMGLRFSKTPVRFDRARLIPLNSIVRVVEMPEPEPVDLLPPPPPIEEEEEIEILISEPEEVEVDNMPEPIVQEDINSMYNEAGMLNPDDILLYLRDFEPESSGPDNSQEAGGAFRFQLPGNTPPLRGEATFERTP
ncbi:MAG: hypothetical protein ACPGN3_03610 [Opitutales bacterium]